MYTNITDFSTVVNPSAEKISQVQINRRLVSVDGVTKAELQHSVRSVNRLENWETLSVTGRELAELTTNECYASRFGIRSASNKKEDVTHYEWIGLDFDNSTLAETLENQITKQASFTNWSFSYQPGENEKHHLFFQCSRRLSKSEYDTVLAKLLKLYPSADVGNHSDALFGGSPKHKEYTYIGGVLDVDNLLTDTVTLQTTEKIPFIHGRVTGKVIIPGFNDEHESAKENGVEKDTVTVPEKPKGGLRRQALLWINKIWVGVCESDINKLYCLYPHKLEDHGSDGGNIAKWAGKNPYTTTPNEPGTGFFIHWQDVDYAPLWRNLPMGTNGNFIEYWADLGNSQYNKGFGDIHYMKDRKNINYLSVLDDIANHFGVEKFIFVADESGEHLEMLQDLSEKYIFVNEAGTYHYYVMGNLHAWCMTKDLDTVWRQGYMEWIRQDYPEVLPDFTKVKLVGQAKQKLTLGILRINQIDSKIFSGKKNMNIVPMADGDYNLVTKELEPYNHENYHTNRHSYRYLQTSAQDVSEFLNYFNIIYKNDDTRQFLINWLAANIAGSAWKLKAMVNIYGTPGSGKSTLGNFLAYLGGSMQTSIDVDGLKNKSNFIYQNLATANIVTIDEFNYIPAHCWDILKKISGGESPIEINRKGLQTFTMFCRVGLTTFSQDSFTIPTSSDGGVLRRIVPIEHTPDMLDEKIPDILDTVLTTKYMEKVFNYLVSLDTTEILAQMKDYAKSTSTQNQIKTILQESDEILNFIKENIKVGSAEEYITYTQLQDSFKDYLENENGGTDLSPQDKQKLKFIARSLRQKANIKQSGFDWKQSNDKDTRITVAGKQIRVLYGLSMIGKATVEQDF